MHLSTKFFRVTLAFVALVVVFNAGRLVERHGWEYPPLKRKVELRELWAQGQLTWPEFIRLVGE